MGGNMIKMNKHITLSFSVVLLHHLLFHSIVVAFNTSGFSLDVIHADNPLSPFRQADRLTVHQRLHDLRNNRTRRSEPPHGDGVFGPLQVTPDVLFTTGRLHLVVVSIGTPAIQYHLELDTGSNLVWTQCEPCEHCVDQVDPIFDPRRSSTYHHVPCTDPLCRPPKFNCVRGRCTYRTSYLDGSGTAGILSRERLTARSAGRGSVGAIESFAFGCSTRTTGVLRGNAAGIFGAGNGPSSFVSQLPSRSGFSYCLSYNPNTVTSLLFGGNIIRPAGMSSTPLIMSGGKYFVNLVGVSILGRRFNLPQGTPERPVDRCVGCNVDTGAAYTHLFRPAYERVREAVAEHLDLQGFKEASSRVTREMQLDLCYFQKRGFLPTPNKYRNLPSMDLHFPSSHLNIAAKHMFIFESSLKAFCLAVVPADTMTTLGNYQQRDIRFIYNVERMALEFGSEDCSRDPRP